MRNLDVRAVVTFLCGFYGLGAIMAFVNKAAQSFYTHARLWYLIDAKDQIVGRLASHISQILMGKTKPIFHPGLDLGDHVVVINTKDVVLLGDKWNTKLYRHHSGYPGGLKEIVAREMHKKDQTVILWRAVNGMLPKTKMRKKRMARLHLFEGPDHPYADRIYAKVKAPAPLPKRLEEYSAEEIENYPKIF